MKLFSIVASLLLSLAIACDGSKIEVIFSRKLMGFAREESFQVFEGSDTTGTSVFTQPHIITASTINYDLCLNPILHTLVLTDYANDGWSSGSSLTITAFGATFGVYRLESGQRITHVLSFSSNTGFGSDYKHNSEPQTGTAWTTQAVSWTDGNTYPPISTITRYFRKTVDVGVSSNPYGIRVSVNTRGGFRVYVNGGVFATHNLPEVITSDTPANSVTETISTIITGSSLSTMPTSIGGLYEIAIEVHDDSSMMGVAETFDCSLILAEGTETRLIDSTGSFSSFPTGTGSEDPVMLYDGLLTTKWSFAYTTGMNMFTTWTFGANRRELVNAYKLATASDTPGRDCVNWIVDGSNDGETWQTLDTQTNVIWTDRHQTQTFNINHNTPYNKMRWRCLALSTTGIDSMQMSELNYLLTSNPFITPSITYPISSLEIAAGVDTVNITPIASSFTTFTVAGPSEASLPTGLNLNPSTGVISGVALSQLLTTIFTISAMHVPTGVVYTTTISITVTGCSLPTSMSVIATKANYASSTETWVLKNASGTIVMTSSITMETIGLCMNVGTYTLTMTSTTGGRWAYTSWLTFKVLVNEDQFVIARVRLGELASDTQVIAVEMPILPSTASMNVKYLADGTVPSNWFTTSFDASTWTTLNGFARPSVAQKLKLFRTTFTMSNLASYHGYEINVKSRAGVIVYVNGNEIYRSYLPTTGDISTSTDATGGDDSAQWRTITGRVNDLVDGTNHVAVAIITISGASALIDFDIVGRPLSDTLFYNRYWDYTVSSSTTGAGGELFDANPDTRIFVNKALEFTQHFTITFNKKRAELYNKYCFITNWDAQRHDPKDWTVSGSNDMTTWIELNSQTNVIFDDRSTEYCFFMATNTKAYNSYRLTLTRARDDEVQNSYSLSDFILYLENLSAVTVPDLSMDPSVLVGYTGAAFPTSVPSSAYYTGFIIAPELPVGLILNSHTGAIHGIRNDPLVVSEFTLSATNHLGEVKTTTISVVVNICSGDMISFTLHFTFETGASLCSFQLKDRTSGEVVDSRSSFINWNTVTIPTCRAATTYTLVLKKTDTSGWGSNNVVVKLADGTILLKESLAAGTVSKEYNFNPAYIVTPRWTEWNYMMDGDAPTNWNILTGAPAVWAVAMPGSFPVATSVTQYYYKIFTTTSLIDFSLLDIAVTYSAGAIIYLNGKEIRRINMPEGDITTITPATIQETVPTRVVTGELVQKNWIVEGDNILAVELHRFETNEVTNSFDASAILILNNMYMILDGVGTTEPIKTGIEGSDKLFDNNSNTKYLTDTSQGCIGVKIIWTYNNNRREPISNFGLVSGNDCLVRSPTSWVIYGSNNGNDWSVLKQAENTYFTSYKQQMRHDFYNEVPYSMYKFDTIKCTNPAGSSIDDGTVCGSTRFQLADFYLFTKNLEGLCPSIDDFKPALNGDNSYINCPIQYQGNKYRTCVNGVFSDIQDHCTPLPPAGISFDMTDLSLFQNKLMTSITPQIIGIKFTCSVFPTLPSGLIIDNLTGTISGTPTTLQEIRQYMITVKNQGGNQSTKLNIEIVEVPINWILIGILIGIVIIIIIVIIVVIIILSKKKGANKKAIPKKSKAGNKPPVKTTTVKTKTVVKV